MISGCNFGPATVTIKLELIEMKISTKGRYACCACLLDIAQQGEGAVVSLKEMSSRQDISVKYLEQIVLKLNRADFLRDIRGVQGGYMLTRPPKEYRAETGMCSGRRRAAWPPLPAFQSEINQCERCEPVRSPSGSGRGCHRAISD